MFKVVAFEIHGSLFRINKFNLNLELIHPNRSYSISLKISLLRHELEQ